VRNGRWRLLLILLGPLALLVLGTLLEHFR
jgi:hypothetical protein